MVNYSNMKFTETGIKDLLVFEPSVFSDDRGYFYEGFKSNVFAEKGFDVSFIQDNIAKSKKGVIRGMHLQKGPYAQTKIIRCLTGAILDIAVDMRKDSPTYKDWYGIELTGDNNKQLFVPRGFAHGYLVLSDEADVMYKVDNVWAKEAEVGFLYNDPEIGIDWGTDYSNLILSDKDLILPAFNELEQEIYT
jgi:dTDP-4-dehydrorhamnose 3,5-epimerase